MVHPRFAPLSAAALLLAAAVCTAPVAAAPAPGEEPPIPTRVAVIPFRCPRPCGEMARLQSGLVDRLVGKATFGLLVTPEMEELLLGRREFRAAMDTLIAQAARGLQPDSAAGAVIARRFRVDGFLYASMGVTGPRVAVWTLTPRAQDVFERTSGQAPRARAPESRHEGAQTKVAQPNTGGAAPGGGGGGTPSGGTSGGGKSTGDPSSQMPNQYSKDVTLVGSTEGEDERADNMAETVFEALHKLLHPVARPDGDH
jgi:hypothetical protein